MAKDGSSFLIPDMPLPFCPGCGQGRLLKELDKALVGQGLSPDRVVIVTDIGCSGLSDRYFTTNTFHGLHGRSITYGTGIRLARPDLEVVVLLGDGGCGIGGAHLLNAARRNIGLTVIVSNNFNYGMTGGEHSVTTPLGGNTSTTPWGNLERPMDLCSVVQAAGGTFVARSTAYDPDLGSLFSRALNHGGFAFLDVWSVCSAYFGPRNELTPGTLKEMSGKSGMTMGVLKEEAVPELADKLHALTKTAKPAASPSIELCFRAGLEGPLGIVVAGSAGQRVRSGASILGRASIASGLYATQKDDYPITVRTGHSTSEVILSPSPIHYTAIDAPDMIVLLSEDGLGQVRGRLDAMPAGSLLLADEDLDLDPLPGVELRRFPFRARARKLGRASVTVLALATLLALRPAVPFEAFLKAAGAHGDPAIAEAGRRASREGFDLVRPA